MSTTGISRDQFGSFQASKDVADPSKELLQLVANNGNQDDSSRHIVSPLFQARLEEETRKDSSFKSPKSQRYTEKKSYEIPSASLQILRNHTSKFGTANEIKEQLNPHSPLSTNNIIEMASMNFIQSNSGALSHPYASTILGHSESDVHLVQDLLSCAEKVSNHQYLSASRLLALCHNLSFSRANVIKRVVYYFAEALVEKIDRETGRFTPKNVIKFPLEPVKPNPALTAFHQKVPLHQITLFAGVQEMVHYVSSCKKVHIIDLEMRCGLQEVVLMQALAARPESLKHLRVTAVVIDKGLEMEEIGVRLRTFAKSLGLNFSFHVMKLEEMLNLHHNFPRRGNDERVIVYASHALKYMIAKPSILESLMRVIRNTIYPCVFIVCEPEGNVNSPVFVNRFVEALFYYSAYFDCVEDCMKNDEADRMVVESNLFSPLLRSTVAAEGEERGSRIVGLNVWRKFFAKFGMVERELSGLALEHANMVLNMFECRDSCTLGLNGNGLVVRWKGTPISSLSAWKFQKMQFRN